VSGQEQGKRNPGLSLTVGKRRSAPRGTDHVDAPNRAAHVQRFLCLDESRHFGRGLLNMHLNGPMNGFKAGPLIKESIGCAVVCATAGSIESQVNCTQNHSQQLYWLLRSKQSLVLKATAHSNSGTSVFFCSNSVYGSSYDRGDWALDCRLRRQLAVPPFRSNRHTIDPYP
jgi:hypothetical protein